VGPPTYPRAAKDIFSDLCIRVRALDDDYLVVQNRKISHAIQQLSSLKSNDQLLAVQ